MKINFGCGLKPRKGWVNVDYVKNDSVDKVVDLNVFPYPFKTASVSHIYSSHNMEHLNDTIGFLKECARILQPKGEANILVPHYTASSAHIPLHKSYYYARWFEVFLIDNASKASLDDREPLFSELMIYVRFLKGFAFWNYLIEWLVNKNDFTLTVWEHHFCYLFPAQEIELVFTK